MQQVQEKARAVEAQGMQDGMAASHRRTLEHLQQAVETYHYAVGLQFLKAPDPDQLR